MPQRMRVILNDRVLYRPLTGVGHYVRQLIAAMAEEARRARTVEVRPFLSSLLPPPRERNGQHGRVVTAPPSQQEMRTNSLGNNWLVRQAVMGTYGAVFRYRARSHALYHEPNHIPLESPVPTITTIHDLSVLLHPEWHPIDRVRWYEGEFEQGRRQTCRFIAASEFTKQEMVQHLNIPADRVDVTLQAPRQGFTPRNTQVVRRFLALNGLPDRFFLFVGTLEPRKNVVGLLEAYVALPRQVRQRHPLVLVGGLGWKTEEIAERLEGAELRDTTRLIGYVSDDVLACLYSACTALVWPSLYEGFGLPPLEAMACGGAVIATDATSVPEVVGDGGVTLDPTDTPAWTAAMLRMVEDDGWRSQWQQRGLARARTFTWQRCAQQTIASYQAALDSL